MTPETTISAPPCAECGKTSVKATGEEVYPHRPEFWDRAFFLCSDCRAWVGTHEKSGKPLGRPGGYETRIARRRAHEVFDQIWKGAPSEYPGMNPGIARSIARKRAYVWLAAQFGESEVHIGEADSKRADAIATLAEGKTYAEIRAWYKKNCKRSLQSSED